MAKELIILIENNNPGLTSKLTVTLLQNGLKIAKYYKTATDNHNQSRVFFSTLDDKIDFTRLKAILSNIDGVLEIKSSTANNDPPKSNALIQLNNLAESIAKKYPDIIRSVFEFEASLKADARNSMLHELGEHTGQYIFNSKFKSYRIDGSIPVALSQLVLPALRPFTIADSSRMEVKLSLSPFALNRNTLTPQCHFISGFIAGLLNNPPDAIPVLVTESACRAQGAEQCVFSITQR